jgi:hypothetical protein
MQMAERVQCGHCEKRYKNRASMSSHICRAHRPDAEERSLGGAEARAASIPTLGKQLRSPRAIRKHRAPPAIGDVAKEHAKLSSALRVQHAYRLGSEVSMTKVVAAQAEVAALKLSNKLLESRLRSAEIGLAHRAKLLSTARNEIDDLQTDRMCVICWERQRCVLLLPCMHYPLCAECLDEMKDNRSGVTPSCRCAER